VSFAAPKSSDVPGPSWRGHMPALDGVRGLAILLVLFYHTTVVEPGAWWATVLHGVWRNFGWTGVDLFFVLSGFLITGILVDTQSSPHYLRNFYARRVLRIFPLYYVYLVAVLVIGPRLSSQFAEAVRVGDEAWSYWLYLQNYIAAWHGEWPHGQLFDHLWSLAIEEQFYLVWPLVVLLCNRRALKYVAIGLLGLSLCARLALDAHGASPVAIYVLTFTRLDGLALGAWIALKVRESETPRVERGMPREFALAVRLPSATVLGVSALAIAALFIWQGTFAYSAPLVRTFGLSLLAVFFASLLTMILTARPDSPLQRWFSNPLLRMLGRYSYGLYVVHFPVIKFTSSALYRLLPERTDLEHQLLLYAIALSVSLGLAVVSWRLLESPVLSLKRYFR
jgi:peptidoglycan/LPS O-acetylase OafA/YrhL